MGEAWGQNKYLTKNKNFAGFWSVNMQKFNPAKTVLGVEALWIQLPDKKSR